MLLCTIASVGGFSKVEAAASNRRSHSCCDSSYSLIAEFMMLLYGRLTGALPIGQYNVFWPADIFFGWRFSFA